MQQEESLQHIQVPNEMAEHDLCPKDIFIYTIIKSHNSKDNRCFPSLATLSKESGISIPTIRKSINKLEISGYLKIKKIGKCNYYYFNSYKTFEPISPELIKNKTITTNSKSYVIATQQHMFKDIQNYGKLSTTNRELSKLINMPESTIRKCNNELKQKGYLIEVNNKSIDNSGFKTKTKIFNLAKLGQAIIWKLKDHEEKIDKNTKEINQLKEIVLNQQKLIDSLITKTSSKEIRYIM